MQSDQENIMRDYHDIVLPFMQRHPKLYRYLCLHYLLVTAMIWLMEVCLPLALRKTCHSLQLYEQLVCFVMAYSFTDSEEKDVCGQTMMVPFVDLLNHHSHHHAELSFYPDRLELVAVHIIDKVYAIKIGIAEETSLLFLLV